MGLVELIELLTADRIRSHTSLTEQDVENGDVEIENGVWWTVATARLR